MDAPSIIDGGSVGVDLSFGIDGVVIFDIGGIDNLNFSTHGIAVQPDGRILLAGNGGTLLDSDAMVLRLLDDGTPDLSFGTSGIAFVDYGAADLGQGLALQADGRILLAISARNSGAPTDSAVARLESDGSLDTSFGTLGISGIDFAYDADASNGVFVGADGKIIFGGQSCCGTTGWDFVNTQLNSDGSLDTNFGTNGQLVSDVFGADEFGTPIAVLDDGRIYALGSTYASALDSFDFAVLRILPNGTLDPAFGTGGVVTADFASEADRSGDLVVYPDGSVLVVGNTGEGATSADFAMIRLTRAGTLDTSFGNAGTATFDIGGNDTLRSALLLPDGRVVAAGSTDRGGSRRLVVMVMQSNGVPDASVGVDGVIEVDLVPGQEGKAWGLALDGAGRVLVFGETNDGSQGDLALVRLVL